MGRSVIHKRMPIPDVKTGSVSDVARILETIEGYLAAGKSLYVHCYGGHGRTGMIVGCYLVQRGLQGKEALDRVRLLHAETSKPTYPSPEAEAQRKMVLNCTIVK